MPPFSELEQAVAKKAQSESDALLAETRTQAQAFWDKESSRLREEHKRRMAALEARMKDELQRLRGDHEAQGRARVLAVKNEIIESAFRAVAEGVRNLPAGGYRRWLREQLLRLPQDQPLQVAANAADLPVISGLFGELGRRNLSVAAEPIPIAGGFVAYGGTTDLDFSIDSAIGALRESLAEEVAARLFASADSAFSSAGSDK